MANEILRASDGKSYKACFPDETFDKERLSPLPKFNDDSNSAKANLPDFSLTGLSEAENAMLQFGGSNSRKLQMLADFVEDDGGKVGEVTLEDMNEALSRDRSGVQRLAPEDRRAIQWMKSNMSSIADETGWFRQGLDLAPDDGISSKELTAYAAKRGVTLKSAQEAKEQMEKSRTPEVNENSLGKREDKVTEGTAGKEAEIRNGASKDATVKHGARAVDDNSKEPADNRVYGYTSLSDLPGFAERNGTQAKIEDEGKVGADLAEFVVGGINSNIKIEDGGIVDYTVKKGDSISSVASDMLRQSLGRAVTQAELRSYVSKVVEMNGLAQAGRRADLIFPGEVLKFPPLCEVPSRDGDF